MKKTKKKDPKSKKKKIAKKPVKAKKVKAVKKLAKVKAVVSKKDNDMNARAQRLFLKGKERGFVTHDEILKEFPHIEDDILFLDQLYAKLHEGSIDILESGGMLDLGEDDPVAKKNVYSGRTADSSYDSIQMYLKEIGQFPLIHAQEEKDLAKSHQKTMCGGACLTRS